MSPSQPSGIDATPEAETDSTSNPPTHTGPLPEEREGRRVGPYLVLSRLGWGGMGEVFLGEDADGKRAALKILTTPINQEVHQKRFEREGHVLEQLDHPNIVRILARGLDQLSRRPFLAMELVEGRDLADLLEQRPTQRLTPDETVFVLERIAQALKAAHEANVIHRDVKPSNVLLTPRGHVKLGDFGIALANDVSVRLTKGEILGTPSYVAPEVLLGEEYSAASDLYALGSLAFRALAGEPLFEGTDATDVYCEVITGEHKPLREIRDDIPDPLLTLVERLLAKKPEDRPDITQVLLVLEDLLPDPEALLTLFSHAVPRGDDTLGAHATPIQSELTLAPDQVFLHYRIEEEIGRGGMGIVYRAFHTGLKKVVALKVMLSGALSKEADRRRFLREAEAASALQHPYIVPVIDAGEHEGTYYMVMDHLEGFSLTFHMKEGRPRDNLLRLFMRICEGVHHAHTRGVIHRDLKPENVMVTGDDSPHILDFGVAKKLDQDASGGLTTEGELLGTLRYMPPEQAAGQVDEVDVRSDVYALGAILYEILCGRTPFMGTGREILHQVHFSEPNAPSKVDEGIPWELDAICLKALEKEKRDRYQSTIELQQDVERFLQGEPIRAKRATLWYRVRRYALRNKAKVTVASAVLVLVAGLLSTLGWMVAAKQRDHDRRILETTQTGWRHYGAGEFAEAAAAFSAARRMATADDLLLLPKRAVPFVPPEVMERLAAGEQARPRITRGRLRDWSAHAKEQVQRAEVGVLVLEARDALRLGNLLHASESVALATRVDPDLKSVTVLVDQVAEALLAEVNKGVVAGRAGNDLVARRKLLETARGYVEAAQRIASARPDVLTALAAVHGELGKLTELDQALALRHANLARANGLVGEAQDALARGELDEARVRFNQALAFDGTNEQAQNGLVDVFGLQQEADRADELFERRQRVERLLREARAAYAEARAAFARGDLPEDVRSKYFEAMESLRRAASLVPEHSEAKDELRGVAREFSVVLIDQGYAELAGFILRIGGVDPSDGTRVELPLDPHLAVVEFDRVNVRRAYGGVVRFLPTRCFDGLRRYLRSQTDELRFVIQVRSRVVLRDRNPKVYAAGLRVRMEDREKGTVSAPVEVPFPGGPYLRPVVVDSRGRRSVRPFDMAQRLDSASYIKEVERIVQRMVRDRKR